MELIGAALKLKGTLGIHPLCCVIGLKITCVIVNDVLPSGCWKLSSARNIGKMWQSNYRS